MKRLAVSVLALAAACSAHLHATDARSDKAQVIPTVYEAGHFFAVPETRDGQRLKLLVDTGGGGGGGMYWITKEAAERLHLAAVDCQADGEPLHTAHVPDYKPQRGLPPPGDGPCGAALLVHASDDQRVDGQLGAGYLPGRVWTFDYPAQRMTLESPAWRPNIAAHETRLGFPHTPDGKLATGFPRITITVDGEPLDMLLDTGATAAPTPEAAKISGTPTEQGQGVTSYIAAGKLDAWHKNHPDWRMLEQADILFPSKPMRVIEVPKVQIAGWSVGPVWFTERSDKNFHEAMAKIMDRAPEGAVGGNVFQHFAMTIDYPRETAYFRCVKGCEAALAK
jgi:predicted aspartyl protease